jgi:RNA recognition motif-containing protein
MIDRETNRHRGFGFVTFQDPNVAEKVLSMGNEGQTTPEGGWKSGKIEIFGKVCEVKASEPKKGGQGHLSSCKSSCSSETSGGLLVPTDIQFQNYYNSGSSMQQQGMNVAGAYNNKAVSQVTASSCAPFVSSTHQEITTAESSSAAADMDGYSSVLNMGQVNPIPSYPSSTYPHATDMMYYAGPYPPYYYADNAMCHPYFYSYQLPDTTNVHGTSLPANYYYPMTGDFVMNHNYGTSYLYPMTPPSLYNAESSSRDYATTTFSITNPQSSTKKSLEKKPVKSGNLPSNVEAKEQKQ